MTQISTPTPQVPSSQTLDFLMKFARTYKPQRHLGKHLILHEEANRTLGEC